MIGSWLRRNYPPAQCIDANCRSTDFLPLGTVHELRPHAGGCDRKQTGYVVRCARCGQRFCVTSGGVYRGVEDVVSRVPAPRIADPNGIERKKPERDLETWAPPRT